MSASELSDDCLSNASSPTRAPRISPGNAVNVTQEAASTLPIGDRNGPHAHGVRAGELLPLAWNMDGSTLSVLLNKFGGAWERMEERQRQDFMTKCLDIISRVSLTFCTVPWSAMYSMSSIPGASIVLLHVSAICFLLASLLSSSTNNEDPNVISKALVCFVFFDVGLSLLPVTAMQLHTSDMPINVVIILCTAMSTALCFLIPLWRS